MYCTRCGKKLNYNSRFCVECANEIANEAALASARAAECEKPTPAVQVPECDNAAPATQFAEAEKAAPAAQFTEAEKAAPVVQAPVCAELVPIAQSASSEKANVRPASAPTQNNGIGKAIASLVMSNVSFFISYLSVFFIIFAPELAFFMLISATPLAIISLVQGIKSIKIFKTFCRSGLKKPVATLVMGIVGLATAATALFIIFIFFIMFVAILAALSVDSYDYLTRIFVGLL